MLMTPSFIYIGTRPHVLFWMTTVQLNSDKTGHQRGLKLLRTMFSTDGSLLGGINLAPSTTVRDLGVLFRISLDLSLDAHIKHVSTSSFKFQHILSQIDAED